MGSETTTELVQSTLVITTAWDNPAWPDHVERLDSFGPFHTIEMMRRKNDQAGLHFFDRDTMRFFRSRVAPGIYNGRVFITSEQFDAQSPRLYTVRAMRDDGSTTELSEFQQFKTLKAARSYVAHVLPAHGCERLMTTTQSGFDAYAAVVRRLKKADRAVALANHELREAQEAYSALMRGPSSRTNS